MKTRPDEHHGGRHDRLYIVWQDMLKRVRNLNNKYYGGKGITVCEEWLSYINFKAWALANGYDETAKRGQCTLERRDGNLGYCPENCYWADSFTQNRNKSSNHPVHVYNIQTGEHNYYGSLAEVEETYHMSSNQPKYYIKKKTIYQNKYIFSDTELTEEELKGYNQGIKYRKKVQCIETSQVFDSVNDASRWSGMSGPTISYSAKHNGAGSCEYHWIFVDDNYL